MITVQNMATVTERGRLADLATRWPVGLTVRHTTGWTGRIVHDEPGRALGYGLGVEAHHAAHALIGRSPHNVAVCVEWVQDGRPATAWYRPGVLSPVGKPKPAPKPAPKPKTTPRKRTWKGAAA